MECIHSNFGAFIFGEPKNEANCREKNTNLLINMFSCVYVIAYV